MFQLFLASLVLQVYIVGCEELDVTPTPEYSLDYTDFEVIVHDEDMYGLWFNEYDEKITSIPELPRNSASSIYPNYYNIIAIIVSYLICLVLHQGLRGSRSVWQNTST